jgi:hypothetical protein
VRHKLPLTLAFFTLVTIPLKHPPGRLVHLSSSSCAFSRSLLLLAPIACGLYLVLLRLYLDFLFLCVYLVLLLAHKSCVDSTSSLAPAASVSSKWLLHAAGNLLVQAQGLIDSTDSNFARRTCDRPLIHQHV